MENPKRFGIFGACLLILAILLGSCGEESTGPTPSPISDYHLIYGPVSYPDTANGPIRNHYFTYSTETGEKIYISPSSELRYVDLIFNKAGTRAIFCGSVPPHGWRGTWIIDYLTGDTLLKQEGIGGTFSLDKTEQYIVFHNHTGNKIATFPDLSVFYAGTGPFEVGGIFGSGKKAFYTRSYIDSLYIIDFSDQSAPVVIPYYLDYPGTRLTSVDYANDAERDLFYLLLLDEISSQSRIMVIDCDSLRCIKQLGSNIPYMGMKLHPNGKQIYLRSQAGAGSSWNRIDIYSVAQNSTEAYFGIADYSGPVAFQPHKIEFTPDGQMMYFLIFGQILGDTPVVGVRLADKAVTQYLVCDTGQVTFFRINPHNFAQK